MERLLVWIYFGNGGHRHQAWHMTKGTPAVRCYKPGVRQPLEVIRFSIMQVGRTGGHMRVFGSDGLDKKSRLGKSRILYLLEWHAAVPRLVEAFHRSPEDFRKELTAVRGLRGDLTQKEILILIGASRYKRLRDVGTRVLPFGQGARNGAKAFLGMPQLKGKRSDHQYNEVLNKTIPQLERVIARLFPRLPVRQRQVTLGDIEPCLCAAFVYTKLVVKLRKRLQTGSLDRRDERANWAAVETLQTPPGFIPHTPTGKPENAKHFPVPHLPYTRYSLTKLPPRRRWTKQHFFRLWGCELAPGPARKRARLA